MPTYTTDTTRESEVVFHPVSETPTVPATRGSPDVVVENRAELAGSSLEVLGGAGAVVLAILALAGYVPFYLLCAAVIAAGVGLFARGAAGVTHVGSEVLGGLAAITLGVLSLLGVFPAILIPVGAIVLGATSLLASPGRPSIGSLSLAGAGALVLGILALLHIGPAFMLSAIAALVVGAGLLLTGGVFLGRREWRHARAR